MRTAMVLWLVALTAVGGCTSTATPDPGTPVVETSSVGADALAAGRAACTTVTRGADTYVGQIASLSDKNRAAMARDWSSSISQAAQKVNDASLRTSLLSLSDVVRGWGERAPDKTSLNGFQHDLTVACRPYLNSSP